jgi:hypothetical protein
VSISRQIAQDVIVAGETVILTGPAGDDVRAAGRLVLLSSPIADHLVAAGENVTLSTDASTGSWAWLAGRVVKILGDVGGELKVAGQEVVIGGAVGGDVLVTAEQIRVLETARIAGRFEYRSGEEPEISEGAVIQGETKRLVSGEDPPDVAGAVTGAIVFTFVLLLGAFVLGAVFLLAFRALSFEAAKMGSGSPWVALAVGFAVLVGLPLLIVASIATVIGLPLAIVALAFYVVVLMVGYVNGAAWVAYSALRRRRPTSDPSRVSLLLTFALVLCVLLLLQLIPLVGQVVGLFVWLIGIGSLTLALTARYRTGPATTEP